MSRRKKYPKLPNGYGSIRYLGKGRRNPYAVHPPTTSFTLEGIPERPPALCYVRTWVVGFRVLQAYHAGKYYKGYEMTIPDEPDDVIQAILADYNRKIDRPTFKAVYDLFIAWKFPEGHSSAASTVRAYTSAFAHCSKLHDRVFETLRYSDLQEAVDSCPFGKGSRLQLKSLFRGMYDYAIINELVDKDYSAKIKISGSESEHGTPFTAPDIRILWEDRSDPTSRALLIMCYSGFRISEVANLEINLEEGYFHGGLKTKAGKDRIVPIHPGIVDLVKECDGDILQCSVQTFRASRMPELLRRLNIASHHTPHDARHTFSALCERYHVSEADRKRMLGHALTDVTNGVYGHRTVNDLSLEITKIPPPDQLS